MYSVYKTNANWRYSKKKKKNTALSQFFPFPLYYLDAIAHAWDGWICLSKIISLKIVQLPILSYRDVLLLLYLLFYNNLLFCYKKKQVCRKTAIKGTRNVDSTTNNVCFRRPPLGQGNNSNRQEKAKAENAEKPNSVFLILRFCYV